MIFVYNYRGAGTMENQVDYTEVGNRIRIQRQYFDMSREKLAELLDLSPYFVGQVERGERKMSISTLIKVSQRLHISIDYLIFGKQNITSTNELYSLLNGCSEKEVKAIVTIIKVILPYLTM